MHNYMKHERMSGNLDLAMYAWSIKTSTQKQTERQTERQTDRLTDDRQRHGQRDREGSKGDID